MMQNARWTIGTGKRAMEVNTSKVCLFDVMEKRQPTEVCKEMGSTTYS